MMCIVNFLTSNIQLLLFFNRNMFLWKETIMYSSSLIMLRKLQLVIGPQLYCYNVQCIDYNYCKYDYSYYNVTRRLHDVLQAMVVILEFCNFVSKGNILFNILMASVMCLHVRIQEEDILEYTNGKCSLCTL